MNIDGPPPDHHHTARDLLPARLGRFGPPLGAIVTGIALFGFLTGIREPHVTERPSAPSSTNAGPIPAAVTYSEMPNAKLGPNANWEQMLAQLKYVRPGIFDPVTRTEPMKQAALADRAKNRAFDGAPPTIPHASEGLYAASCLACHGESLKVGDRIASKISHAHLSNCSQCHVAAGEGRSPFRDQPPENGFVGVYRAGPGQRASPGAPPTIPHHTWMRENCASCHGLITRPGTRTTHPWLTNCTQCHAPSAALDQVEFSGGRP
jgi:nitrate reductase (cytochrome), electron transfer subunit